MDPELGGDGPYPPVLDEVVAQDLRLELVVERHRARRSVPGATPSASSYRRATPLPTDELAERARAEVAVHLGSAARCASSLGGRFGRHRRIGLAHRNSMRGEFSIARGASGTVMRHFVRARAFAAPAPVAPLALGMTVAAAPRVLIPASRPAQRFTPSEAAAARPAVVLAPVTAQADEHLAPASGTEKQSGIVHCSPRRGGLDDPRSPGNTALGAVRKCGSGRSLGRDRQVSAVRGCVSLLADSDLTPTHERRHRRYARRAPPLAGSIGSGGKPRHVPGGRGGAIQRWFASTGTVSSRGLFAIYPRIFTATNKAPLGHASAHAAMRGLGTIATRWRTTGQRIVESEPWILWRYSTRHWLGNLRGLPRQPATQPQRVLAVARLSAHGFGWGNAVRAVHLSRSRCSCASPTDRAPSTTTRRSGGRSLRA